MSDREPTEVPVHGQVPPEVPAGVDPAAGEDAVPATGSSGPSLPPSLASEDPDLTRTRIRRAALEVVARRGFDATVDEIALVSGVSPRTIFRHYGSHDALILATVKDMFEAAGQPASPLGDDVDGWLRRLAMVVHTRNLEVIGEAFWDIHVPTHETSEVLAEVHHIRRDARVRGVRYLTRRAWSAAGGTGEPPRSLVLAFGLYFSGFSTYALMTDFDRTPEEVGAVSADILQMLLWRAVRAQQAQTGRDDAPEASGAGVAPTE